MTIGSHGLPPYRTFTLEELEQATNNFDTSSFMGKGTQGQVHKGIEYMQSIYFFSIDNGLCFVSQLNKI